MDCGFYLTTEIINSSRLDYCANCCLTPLRTLIQLASRTNTIRQFQIIPNSNRQKVIEIDPLLETSLQKIVKIIIAIFLVIPGTVIGFCLKQLALCDAKVIEQNDILFSSTQFIASSLTKEEDSPIPGISKDVFLTNVIPFFSYKDLACIQGINKTSRAIIQAPHSKLIDKQNEQFHGFDTEEKASSWHQFSLSMKEHVEKYCYTSELFDLFGGLQNVLKLPIFELKEVFYRNSMFDPALNEVEHFVYNKLPVHESAPIFRLRLKWSDKTFEEMIIIKYSLFLPKEHGDMRLSLLHLEDLQKLALEERNNYTPTDRVWHDYLTLRWNKYRWILFDPRFPNDRFFFRKFMLGQDPSWGYKEPLFESTFLEEADCRDFKKFLADKKTGFFRGRDRAKAAYFVKGSKREKSGKNGRLFSDIPVVLGHQTPEEISTLFQIKEHADFNFPLP